MADVFNEQLDQPGASTLREQALAAFEELEARIDSFELDIYYYAQVGRPCHLTIQTMWADVEQGYNDALKKLDLYLFVKGLTHVTKMGFPWDALDAEEVWTAVSDSRQVVLSRHARGLTEDAAHIMNLADSTLWNGNEVWRDTNHQVGIPPKLWDMAKKKTERGKTEISLDEPVSTGEEGNTPTTGERLPDHQADTPQATELASELKSWDQELERVSTNVAIPAEPLMKQARAWMGLRLLLRQQLMYLADRPNATKQFFDPLFDALSQLPFEDDHWEERLNQAIAEHPIESLTAAGRLATANPQSFRIPLYKKSDRGFELDKDASEFLQRIVFGKTGQDEQANFNKILRKNLVPVLNRTCLEFPLFDLFEIQEKTEEHRKLAQKQRIEAAKQKEYSFDNIKCWDLKLKQLTNSMNAPGEEKANLFLKALQFYLRWTVLLHIGERPVEKSDSASVDYYIQETYRPFTASRLTARAREELLKKTIDGLPLARLLSQGTLPASFEIPLYSADGDRQGVLQSEASEFFTDVLAWPPEQVYQQIDHLVLRLDAIRHQCGTDIWGIAARVIELQNAEGGERR